MENGNIYAQKNTFAKRYGSVKLTSLTGTPPPYAIRGGEGGLVPHPPRKEKNGIKTRPYRWQNQRKNALLKAWQKVAKNGKIRNYNYKNPYIFFVIVERAKLVMYVGA